MAPSHRLPSGHCVRFMPAKTCGSASGMASAIVTLPRQPISGHARADDGSPDRGTCHVGSPLAVHMLRRSQAS